MPSWRTEAMYIALLIVMFAAAYTVLDALGAPHSPMLAGLIALPASIIARRVSGRGARPRPR